MKPHKQKLTDLQKTENAQKCKTCECNKAGFCNLHKTWCSNTNCGSKIHQ